MSEAESFSSTEKLLAIIKSHPDGLSEYQLLTLIYQDCVEVDLPNLSDSLVLFQQHFCLFHALYRLRDHLHLMQAGTLLIGVLKIQWLPAVVGQTAVPGEHDGLRDYYLNTDNLANASRDQVEDLLSSFWQRMLIDSEQHLALEALGLTEPVTWQDIKKRYRQCVSVCHPDRGGSHIETVKLNEAMAILERCYC